MAKKKDSGQHEEKVPSEYKVKTMVDGDFRLPSKLRERIGFGNKTDLKVTILQLLPNKSVKLLIEKVNLNKPT